MIDLTEIANEKLIGINSIPPNVLESIENIVDYLYKDEMQDWFCFDDTCALYSGKAFCNICVVQFPDDKSLAKLMIQFSENIIFIF